MAARQTTLKATIENTLVSNICTFLYSNDPNNGTYQVLADEVNRLLNLSVAKPIIYYNMTTVIVMLKTCKNYDVLQNQNKIDKMLSLIYVDDDYRKDLLGQTVIMSILYNKKVSGTTVKNDLMDIFNKNININIL